MGWLVPLGSHKVMGSFAGYSVSVSTFKIVRLFFNGFFFWCCDLMDCLLGPFFFHARGPRTVRLAHTVQLFLCLKTSWMSFFSRGLVYSFGQQKTFFSMTNQKPFFFSCAWRRLVMSEEDSWCLKKPGEAFHARRHRASTSTPRVPLSCASDTNLTVTYTLRLTD